MSKLDEVIKARAEERRTIEEVRKYVERLRERLGAISAAVFGSYARGDFNLWSDVDLIVVSQSFKGVEFVRRCLALMDAPPRLEAICWTPEEAAKALRKPWWMEALKGCITLADDYGVFTMCQAWNGFGSDRRS